MLPKEDLEVRSKEYIISRAKESLEDIVKARKLCKQHPASSFGVIGHKSQLN